MFTRHANDLLKCYVFFIIVLSIIAFLYVYKISDFASALTSAFIVFYFGITIFTGVGIKVEQANEIMDINEKMTEMLHKMEKLQKETQQLKEANKPLSDISTENKTVKQIKFETRPRKEGSWICNYCSSLNSSDSLYCKECGNKK